MCYQSSEACRGAKLKQIASKLFESSLKSFTRNSAWQGPISTSIGRNLFQRNLSSIEDRRRLRCKHYQKLTYKLSILNTLSLPIPTTVIPQHHEIQSQRVAKQAGCQHQSRLRPNSTKIAPKRKQWISPHHSRFQPQASLNRLKFNFDSHNWRRLRANIARN